jgi:hypothetical protein
MDKMNTSEIGEATVRLQKVVRKRKSDGMPINKRRSVRLGLHFLKDDSRISRLFSRHNKNQNETAAVTQDPFPKTASENQVVNCETSSSALCANTIRGNESQLFLSESAIQFVSEVDKSVVVKVSSRRRSCGISVLGVISVEEPDKPVDNAPVSSESTSPVVYVPDDPAVVS